MVFDDGSFARRDDDSWRRKGTARQPTKRLWRGYSIFHVRRAPLAVPGSPAVPTVEPYDEYDIDYVVDGHREFLPDQATRFPFALPGQFLRTTFTANLRPKRHCNSNGIACALSDVGTKLRSLSGATWLIKPGVGRLRVTLAASSACVMKRTLSSPQMILVEIQRARCVAGQPSPRPELEHCYAPRA